MLLPLRCCFFDVHVPQWSCEGTIVRTLPLPDGALGWADLRTTHGMLYGAVLCQSGAVRGVLTAEHKLRYADDVATWRDKPQPISLIVFQSPAGAIGVCPAGDEGSAYYAISPGRTE